MDKYIDLLKSKGADICRIIDPKTVITAPWTIYKCQFGCKNYNNSFCCPPKTPNYKQTQEILDCYHTAILFRCHNMEQGTAMAVEVGRELLLDGYYKSIAFGCGPCTICGKCDGETCKNPEKTEPSMEACGIDVFATVRNNGYEINIESDPSSKINIFGLLLVE